MNVGHYGTGKREQQIESRWCLVGSENMVDIDHSFLRSLQHK